MDKLSSAIEHLAATQSAFSIESRWDDGFHAIAGGTNVSPPSSETPHWDDYFRRVADGKEFKEPTFSATVFAMASMKPRTPGRISNVFDDAYGIGVDTRLSYDGNQYTVELPTANAAASFGCFKDAAVWLDAKIAAQGWMSA